MASFLRGFYSVFQGNSVSFDVVVVFFCVYVVACQKRGVNLEFSFAAVVKVLRVS